LKEIEAEDAAGFRLRHLEESVGTLTLRIPFPLTKALLEQFLQKILWEMNETHPDTQIWRTKVSNLILIYPYIYKGFQKHRMIYN